MLSCSELRRAAAQMLGKDASEIMAIGKAVFDGDLINGFIC